MEIVINYDVPQGSPINTLLFLLYMSKHPKLLPNTNRSLLADDFMIYSESSITRYISLVYIILWEYDMYISVEGEFKRSKKPQNTP